MAEPHRGLPNEIAIWGILLRLPPKSILRCGAVCRTWRFVTSTRDFLLAHHARQPTLPLLYDHNSEFVDLVPFDCRPGVAATDRLHLVARLGPLPVPRRGHPLASCDGLLLLSINYGRFAICNPTTRQYAPIRLPSSDFRLMGMYRHSPTAEYRLLLFMYMYGEFRSYILTLGSGQRPRRIEGLNAEELTGTPSVLFRGNLHWYAGVMIMVFDTTSESSRWMRAPVLPRCAKLLEMHGMLAMSSFNDAETTIHIWMLQDYESEVWAVKYRVQLPVAEFRLQFGKFAKYWNMVVTSWKGDVLVLVRFGKWLLQFDMDGKLVANFRRKGRFNYTQLLLKQTLVSHTFFPALEGCVVNDSPFV